MTGACERCGSENPTMGSQAGECTRCGGRMVPDNHAELATETAELEKERVAEQERYNKRRQHQREEDAERDRLARTVDRKDEQMAELQDALETAQRELADAIAAKHSAMNERDAERQRADVAERERDYKEAIATARGVLLEERDRRIAELEAAIKKIAYDCHDCEAEDIARAALVVPTIPAPVSGSVAKRHAIMREAREKESADAPTIKGDTFEEIFADALMPASPATATKREQCRHVTLERVQGGLGICSVCGDILDAISTADVSLDSHSKESKQ